MINFIIFFICLTFKPVNIYQIWDTLVKEAILNSNYITFSVFFWLVKLSKNKRLLHNPLEQININMIYEIHFLIYIFWQIYTDTLYTFHWTFTAWKFILSLSLHTFHNKKYFNVWMYESASVFRFKTI